MPDQERFEPISTDPESRGDVAVTPTAFDRRGRPALEEADEEDQTPASAVSENG